MSEREYANGLPPQIGDVVHTASPIEVHFGSADNPMLGERIDGGTMGTVAYLCDDGAIGVHWDQSWSYRDGIASFHAEGHMVEVMPREVEWVVREHA